MRNLKLFVTVTRVCELTKGVTRQPPYPHGEIILRTRVQKFNFDDSVDLEQAEGTLMLAIIAAEALHGKPAVRLEARYLFSTEKRACVIERCGHVSDDVITIFTGFLIHEFGEDAFKVASETHVENVSDKHCSCNETGNSCACGKNKGAA